MGKSGGRKKKGGVSQNQVPGANNKPIPNANVGVDLNSSILLKRAHEFKEEGNKRFQAKDYVGALEQYDCALKLTPKTHQDRAVFHSNRAACLMQMKPIDYETVISECSMALQVEPRYGRALLRMAKAFEAIRKYEMAMLDVQALLGSEPNHGDALEIGLRLRTALGPLYEAQLDLQSRASPAALGALARPVPKKATASALGQVVLPSDNKPDKPQLVPITESGPKVNNHLPKLALKPSNDSTKSNATKVSQKEQATSSVSLALMQLS